MATVLVTVVWQGRRHDVAISADSPVAELLGPLLATLTEHRPSGGREPPTGAGSGDPSPGPSARDLVLSTHGGPALPRDRSLAASGVADGAMLVLTARPPADHDQRGDRRGDRRDDRSATRRSSPTGGPAGGGVGRAASVAAGRGRWRAGAARQPDLCVWQRGLRVRQAGLRVRRGRAATDRERLLDAAIAAPQLRRCVTIAVLSGTAGVRTTTVTALLAATLSAVRGERVVAVDANPGATSLSALLAPDHRVLASDVLGVIDHPALTGPDLLSSLAWVDGGPSDRSGRGRPGPGLAVLAARPKPDGTLDRHAWYRLVRGVARHLDQASTPGPAEPRSRPAEPRGLLVESGGLPDPLGDWLGMPVTRSAYRAADPAVLLVDGGTGVANPGARGALATADQVVLVVDPSLPAEDVAAAEVLAGSGLPFVAAMPRAPQVPWAPDATFADEVAARLPGVRGAALLDAATVDRAASAGVRARGNPMPDASRRPACAAKELAWLITAEWVRLRLADPSRAPRVRIVAE